MYIINYWIKNCRAKTANRVVCPSHTLSATTKIPSKPKTINTSIDQYKYLYYLTLMLWKNGRQIQHGRQGELGLKIGPDIVSTWLANHFPTSYCLETKYTPGYASRSGCVVIVFESPQMALNAFKGIDLINFVFHSHWNPSLRRFKKDIPVTILAIHPCSYL